MRLTALPDEFRQKASALREDGAAEGPARAWDRAAELVEEALQEADLDALTLEEAEVFGGYTRRHLHRLLSEGVIPNAGGAGDPKILRRHVPVKPGHRVADGPRLVSDSRAQAARAVAGGY